MRACESRLPQPILGDRFAAAAVDRIDYDFTLTTSGIVSWGTRDGGELVDAGLDPVETTVFVDPARIPLRPQRLLYRLLCAIPGIRNYDRLFRFRF